jgi:hypothetical protein
VITSNNNNNNNNNVNSTEHSAWAVTLHVPEIVTTE